MLQTLANTLRVPDLRRRLLFTIGILCLCRLGVFIPVPGTDLSAAFAAARPIEGEGAAGGVMALIDMFSGGGLQRAAVFGLGIMPYISASIIFQLLGSVVPALERLQKEGEAGRQKINQYTRYATVGLCIVQAAIMIASMRRGADGPGLFPPAFGFGSVLLAALLMTTGTLFLMWLGEQIDEFGIGNGISLIIMVNIISAMPTAVRYLYGQFQFTLDPDPGHFGIDRMLILVGLFLFIIWAVVLVTQGQRRIPFQQAKQTRGRRVYGGVKHYLPIQVNSAGVIPIIFAQSLLMFPGIFTGAIVQRFQAGEWDSPFWFTFFYYLNRAVQMDSFVYQLLYVALIFFFCYFWTAIQFNPTDMASNLRDHGSFIPGYRPGKRTADYLESVMTRVTLPGATFLSIIAILPMLLNRWLRLPWIITGFYGGTGLLIVVGVALDLVKKIEQQLLMRHYDGFTRRSRR